MLVLPETRVGRVGTSVTITIITVDFVRHLQIERRRTTLTISEIIERFKKNC
jgi:hypothetical protein